MVWATTDADKTETCEHVDVVNNLLKKQYAMINYKPIAKIKSYSAIAVLNLEFSKWCLKQWEHKFKIRSSQALTPIHWWEWAIDTPTKIPRITDRSPPASWQTILLLCKWIVETQLKSRRGEIERTDSLPPAEEYTVELDLEESWVGVPPARRRDRGVQRDRRVELRHEPPHVLGRGLGRGDDGTGRPCAGAERRGAGGSGGVYPGERSASRHRRRRPAHECDRGSW